MKLSGLHLLLTYQCTYQCDHCFVWGAPGQPGTMSLEDIDRILAEATSLGTVEWIYFEGGEPFLYYPILVEGVRRASNRGFKIGIVSNAYWARTRADAIFWLSPMAGRVHDLSVSNDQYHGSGEPTGPVAHAREAASELGIPTGEICIAPPGTTSVEGVVGQLPENESAVMYRGRAAVRLADRAEPKPAADFTACPHEDLRDPGRVHVDPLGNVHVCQGISIGNLFETSLPTIWRGYDPDAHPITGPLLNGGPAALAGRYGLDVAVAADACHLCFESRSALRDRFPELLLPDQMYGEPT